MNYIAPNFHLQQGDELGFQTSISLSQQQQQNQTLQDMFVVGPSVAVDDRHPSIKLQTTQRRNMVAPATIPDDANNDDNRNNKKRKIIHRDVERQRRHEMAMLYSSLRSLLPIEYLKGKRSISDHMNEAANYIKHQQRKIRELTEKRDGLRRVVLPLSNPNSDHMNGSFSFPIATVRPCLDGVEVVIGSGLLLDGVRLSKVIKVLEEEGLDVFSCVFTNLNEQLLYTLHCELAQVVDQRELDLHGLQQNLVDLILSSS